MKPKEIETLESYFKTDNEHWNGHTLDMLCEAIQQGLFENLQQPLQLFNEAENIFLKHHQHPLQAVTSFADEIEKNNLNPQQKLFVYERVYMYLKNSVFEEGDFTAITELVKVQKEKLQRETQPVKPLVKNIRENLKDLMQQELEQLPETLKQLEPAQRLNILIKLIPFVLPKVESIEATKGEPYRLFED